MDEVGLLERPQAAREAWLAPETVQLSAMRDLMLHRLCALSHRMRAIAVRDVLSEHELDLRDWSVLAALNDLGEGTQRELSLATAMDKVAVNRAASRLKQLKLVVSRPNACDGRSHHLELSPLGRQTLAQCSSALMDFERDAMSRFTAAEYDQMSRFIDRLMDTVEPAN